MLEFLHPGPDSKTELIETLADAEQRELLVRTSILDAPTAELCFLVLFPQCVAGPTGQLQALLRPHFVYRLP